MKKILADHNADGHVEVLLRTLLSDDWLGLWNRLGAPLLTFAHRGHNDIPVFHLANLAVLAR
jgi:hypothetical protein